MSRDPSPLDDREELERRLQELQGQLEDFRRRHGELRLALETLTTIDPVSGVRNRLGILQSMEGSLQWNKREGLPFGVAVMHIPGLADLRRQEDHDLFEESLAHVAAVISAGLRDVDRVGRWSDDVFVVVLAKLDANGVRPVTARLVSMLSAVPIQGEHGTYELTPGLTVILVEPEAGITVDDLAGEIDASQGSEEPDAPRVITLGRKA
jgi:diguanylate cyclase (GGDEF)-like protein